MTDTPPPSDRRKLVALLLLGSASALWAGFLWHELLESRGGGEPFCGFGDGADCAALWDAAFASAVHRFTGLPVAGWGLAWGLVATFLPALLLARRGADHGMDPQLRGAVRWTALLGVFGVVGLLLISLSEGLFCKSCALTYLLTGLYAVVAFVPAWSDATLRRGFVPAVLLTLAAFLVLLYPGLRTPKNTEAEGRRALARLAETRAEETRNETRPPESPAEPRREPSQETDSGSNSSEATGKETADEVEVWERETRPIDEIAEATGRDFENELRQLIDELPQSLKQGLADSIYFFEHARAFPPQKPRAFLGSATAPVLLTEFTDTLCSHCANLHENLGYLLRNLPEEAWAFEARQFPLDGRCNPHLSPRPEESVRCLAAKVKICMESHPQEAFEYAGDLYAESELTERRVFELAEPYVFKTPLEECVEREETREKLEADADYAWRYEIQGTPLVLVNGREAPPFGPFLYAMVLTGGDTRHPVFQEMLPAPSPGIPVRRP